MASALTVSGEVHVMLEGVGDIQAIMGIMFGINEGIMTGWKTVVVCDIGVGDIGAGDMADTGDIGDIGDMGAK